VLVHGVRKVVIANPQIGARLLDVPMAEQPMNLVQVPPRRYFGNAPS
jgi:hypothetical protein